MQMRMDIDKEVQVRAIQTAESMAIQDLLSDQAGLNFREQIYQMITEEDEDLRSASATFIKASYIDLDLEPEYKKLSKKFGKSVPARDVYMLKGIVELLSKFPGVNHIMAMIDCCSASCDHREESARQVF